MSTLSTFHLFPALPIEIRLKIWYLLLSVSRTVICTRKDIITNADPRGIKVWDTNTPFPPLLYVNRESRYEALAVYTPYFWNPSNPRPIYLSLSRDVVRFSDHLLPYIPAPLREIKHMMMDTKDCVYFGYYHMRTLKSMMRLRELEIYVDNGQDYGMDDGDRSIKILVSEFESTMEFDPGWECPNVRIVDAQTGKELRFIEGGAKLPGWIDER